MNVALLGLGLQGKAALHDLVTFGTFEQILAIDSSAASLDWVKARFASASVSTGRLDLNRPNALAEVLSAVPAGIVIDLLPIQLIPQTARQAIQAGWHYVNTYYTLPELCRLDQQAQSKGLIMLPECGFDPGIDLVLAGDGFRKLDAVTEYLSYGGGVPEASACDNPLNYKITWTFEGVLNSYYRPARIVRDGQVLDIPGEEIFAPANTHTVDIGEVGRLEAFPNGDVTKYVDMLGLENIQRAGRYALRWPGHCRFWYVISKLGLLTDKNVKINGMEISQRRILAQLIEPRLKYQENERDIAVLRVEVAGQKAGENRRLVYEMIDYRDLNTGLMAMNRTVGFTAAIAAQMIADGSISKPGLLSLLADIPYRPFVEHLTQRGINVRLTPLPGASH